MSTQAEVADIRQTLAQLQANIDQLEARLDRIQQRRQAARRMGRPRMYTHQPVNPQPYPDYPFQTPGLYVSPRPWVAQ